MFLDATTKSITAVLAEAVASTDMVVTAAYEDLTTTTFLAGGSDGTTSGTAAATIVAAPAASTQRRVREISLYNADTILHTVTVALLDNGTSRSIYTAPVSPNTTLYYSNGVWSTIPYRSISRAGVKTQVNQLDVGGAYQESLVGPFTPVPTADTVTAASQSSDAPTAAFIVGDPNGDLAGTNIIEKLVDDSGDLKMAVRVVNPAGKFDAQGAQMVSDAPAPINLVGATGQFFIIDTTGYQCLEITTNANMNLSFTSSNDGITWASCLGYATSGNSNSPTVNIGGGAAAIIPAVARYIRLQTTVAGSAVAYLRNIPAPNPAVIMPQNIAQVGGGTVATASGTITGLLAVAGPQASGAGQTVGPVPIGGIDSGTPGIAPSGSGVKGAAAVRQFLTDNTGRLRLAEESPVQAFNSSLALSVTDVTQADAQTPVELLVQMLLELKILNQQLFTLISIESNSAPDTPEAYRNDQTVFN